MAREGNSHFIGDMNEQENANEKAKSSTIRVKDGFNF